MHSRTLSITRTWTSRQGTLPDWLLGARRSPVTPTSLSVDPEQGQEIRVRERETLSDGHVLSRTASIQSARVGPDSPIDGHGISSALSRPGMPRDGSVSARTSQVSMLV